MNAKKITAAVILFAAAGASFADTKYPPETKFVSTKTRAEVIAELKQARAEGWITNGNNYPAFAAPHSTQTRAEVASQLKAPAKNDNYRGS